MLESGWQLSVAAIWGHRSSAIWNAVDTPINKTCKFSIYANVLIVVVTIYICIYRRSKPCILWRSNAKNTTFCETDALNAIVTRHIQHSRTQTPSVTTKPCEMRTNWIQHNSIQFNFCNNSCVVRVQICTRECSLNGHSVSTQVPVSAMWKCDVGRDNRINNKGCVLNAVGSNDTELYSHGQNTRLRSRFFVVFTSSHVFVVVSRCDDTVWLVFF